MPACEGWGCQWRQDVLRGLTRDTRAVQIRGEAETGVLTRGTQRTRPGGEPVKEEGSPAVGREGSGGVLCAADHADNRGTERCLWKLLTEEGEPPAPRPGAGRREVTAGN